MVRPETWQLPKPDAHVADALAIVTDHAALTLEACLATAHAAKQGTACRKMHPLKVTTGAGRSCEQCICRKIGPSKPKNL